MKKHSAEDQLKDFMDKNGVDLPQRIKADGKFHRFPVSNDSGGERSGWYVLHRGFPAYGACGNWKTGAQQGWRENSTKSLTEDQQVEVDQAEKLAKAQYEKERAKIQKYATRNARELWDQAEPADPDHPYLRAKVIDPHCARQSDDKLIIPLYSEYEVGRLKIPLFGLIFCPAFEPGDSVTSQYGCANGINL